jgi:CheY-like chemotaxis protein
VRLQQMLLNLGTNALKFTEVGEVELGLRIEGDHLRFSVRDTGPGLPPEVQAKLFQPFVQANAGTHRTHGGTGLGLAIVRGLAGVMNGTVGVESTFGSGSTFWFTAKLPPTTPAEHRAPALVPASQIEQDDELLQLLEPEVLPEPRRAAPPSAPADDPPSVLLVEDDPSNARVVAAALSREGARVTVASDGALAITFARNAHFDLILLDSHLPDMDGPTVARVLRALPVEGKIVALTGEVGEQARGRSLAAGMDAHLTKPISRAELGELLRTCRRPLSAAS